MTCRPPTPAGDAPLQTLALDDVAATVVRLLEPGAATRIVLVLAGPEAMSFTEMLRRYCRWLGFGPAVELRLQAWLAQILYRLGDLPAQLGWRPPVRTTAQREIARGGDPSDGNTEPGSLVL